MKVSPDTAGNTWAPEAYYDDTHRRVRRLLGLEALRAEDTAHTGNTYNRMMYATTRDFRTFSEPKVWVDPGYSVIDSTVIKHDGTYYRFTKDERNNTSSTPCSKFILEEKSTQLRSPNWDFVEDCIGKATDTSAGIAQGEGPTIFKSQHRGQVVPVHRRVRRARLRAVRDHRPRRGRFTMSTGYDLPAHPRHGTVLPVTKAELDRLRRAFRGFRGDHRAQNPSADRPVRRQRLRTAAVLRHTPSLGADRRLAAPDPDYTITVDPAATGAAIDDSDVRRLLRGHQLRGRRRPLRRARAEPVLRVPAGRQRLLHRADRLDATARRRTAPPRRQRRRPPQRAQPHLPAARRSPTAPVTASRNSGYNTGFAVEAGASSTTSRSGPAPTAPPAPR